MSLAPGGRGVGSEETLVSAEVGIVSLASAGLPTSNLSPPLLPHHAQIWLSSLPLILLSSPEPSHPLAPPWREPHPSPDPGPVGPEQFSRPAAPLLPITLVCAFLPFTFSLSPPPSFCPPLRLCLPPLSSSPALPSHSSWPFLQGSLHSHYNLPSSLSKWGCSH